MVDNRGVNFDNGLPKSTVSNSLELLYGENKSAGTKGNL